MTKRQEVKRAKGLCVTPYCRNTHAPTRTICHKCYARADKEKNPLKHKFYNLRTNAKRRGKDFSLTFKQFSDIAYQSGYDKLSGRKAQDLTLDRIVNSEGYHAENIQVLSKSENCIKGVHADAPF